MVLPKDKVLNDSVRKRRKRKPGLLKWTISTAGDDAETFISEEKSNSNEKSDKTSDVNLEVHSTETYKMCNHAETPDEDHESIDDEDDEIFYKNLGSHFIDLGKMAPGRLDSLSFEVIRDPSFNSLEGYVSSKTLKAIDEMGLKKMTEIQAKSIPKLLQGRNLVGNAKTGSGKTLAFLIPAVELITKLKFKSRHGTGCIVISPTRELAMQTFGVLQDIMKYHPNTYGVIMGGAHRKTEVKKLQKGVNILVATPGRLLDHLQNTPRFMTENLMCLIIDEADRILEIGFEEEMKQIVEILPKKRQTMLFSATSTKKTEDFRSLAIKVEPVIVDVQEKQDIATVKGLKQGYIVCPAELRFLVLYSFLKMNLNKKIMVFFSTCMSVKFHYVLLNGIKIPVESIHGKQAQSKRTITFFKFCNSESGILLCTDVAARGLDIPAVDWIIQYDPPDDTKEYIHRVGRTARGEGGKGRAMIFLRPEELPFLYYLKESKVSVDEYKPKTTISNIQLQLEQLVSQSQPLNAVAKAGFKACFRSYETHRMRKVFNIKNLDIAALAKNFGLKAPPSAFLNTNSSQTSNPRKRKGTDGFGFSNKKSDRNFQVS